MDEKKADNSELTIWRTALGRSDFEFRSALHTPDAPFFLSVEHVEAITKARSKQVRISLLYFFASIAVAVLILAGKSSLVVDIKTPIGSIDQFQVSNVVLLLALSILTGLYAKSATNGLLLIKQLYGIFEHSGLATSPAMSRALFFSSRWSADDLWLDLFNIRPFGFRSGLIHILLVAAMLLVLILVSFSQLCLLLAAAFVALTEARSGDQLVYYLIALPSFISILAIVAGIPLAMMVPMRFKLNQNQDVGSNLDVDGDVD